MTHLNNMTMNRGSLAFLAVGAAALSTFSYSLTAAPPRYRIEALDELQPAAQAWSVAWSINNHGESAGKVVPIAPPFPPSFFPFPASWSEKDGASVLPELSDLWGGTEPYAINDSGEMAGFGFASPSCCSGWAVNHAFFYSPQLGHIDITPDCEGGAWAMSLNNHGEVVGTIGQGGVERGFKWSLEEGMTFLETTPVFWSFPFYPQDINDDGLIVGNTSFPGMFPHASYWTPEDGVVMLPNHSGAAAFVVNNNGLIAGQTAIPGPLPCPTCLPLVRATVWIPGPRGYEAVLIPPAPGFDEGQATGANDDNVVVGLDAVFAPGVTHHGWMWRDGVRTALLDLLDDPTGWVRLVPYAINNAGQIVGIAETADDSAVAFRMTPIITPPPVPADLNGDGLVNGIDLGILLSQWFARGEASADLNGDGVVNGVDLGILLAAWTH